MGKSRINKKRFNCGHKGFGSFCHRCEEAEQLESFANSGKKYITHKKHKKPKTWTKKELLDEASRLKKVRV